jgi:hypothetical protein
MLATRIGSTDGPFRTTECRSQHRLVADLIEAMDAVAATAEPCDPAIVKAFRHRPELRADVRPLFEPAAMGTGGLERSGFLQTVRPRHA